MGKSVIVHFTDLIYLFSTIKFMRLDVKYCQISGMVKNGYFSDKIFGHTIPPKRIVKKLIINQLKVNLLIKSRLKFLAII